MKSETCIFMEQISIVLSVKARRSKNRTDEAQPHMLAMSSYQIPVCINRSDRSLRICGTPNARSSEKKGTDWKRSIFISRLFDKTGKKTGWRERASGRARTPASFNIFTETRDGRYPTDFTRFLRLWRIRIVAAARNVDSGLNARRNRATYTHAYVYRATSN